jgi:hypothetical protein
MANTSRKKGQALTNLEIKRTSSRMRSPRTSLEQLYIRMEKNSRHISINGRKRPHFVSRLWPCSQDYFLRVRSLVSAFDCPDSHTRPDSRCGNIVGTGKSLLSASTSALAGDKLLGSSCAREVPAAITSPIKTASGTRTFFRFCRRIFGVDRHAPIHLSS